MIMQSMVQERKPVEPAYIKVSAVVEDKMKVEYESDSIQITLGNAYLSLHSEYLIANKDEARKLSDFIQNVLQDKGV